MRAATEVERATLAALENLEAKIADLRAEIAAERRVLDDRAAERQTAAAMPAADPPRPEERARTRAHAQARGETAR